MSMEGVVLRKYRTPLKSEAQLEERVRDWCKDNGWKRKKMSSPGSKGTLDDYFLKDKRHVWIELKFGKNTPSKLQWMEINDIREHGGQAFWCNTLEQVISILTEDPEFTGMPPQHDWMM